MDEETIVAPATAPGRAGIAVIRLSGGRSEEILRGLMAPLPGRVVPRRSYRCFLHVAGRPVDECLAVLFRAPRSYSGEDMAEISLHGNPFLVEAALAQACRLGARAALPGEFTYRALRNGKLDLPRAEAVNDLVNAGSRAAALLQFGNLEGRLSQAAATLRDALLGEAAAVEAAIEFAEDQHLEGAACGSGLEAAAAALEAILAGSRFGQVLQRGLRVAIAGRVNVGKSSLFNALLLEERAIVSHLPGTTRDTLAETLLLDGAAFRISDAAGLRAEAGDGVENEGMRRSLDLVAGADAVLLVVDASRPLGEEDREIHRLLAGKKRLLLANKCDLTGDEAAAAAVRAAFPGEPVQAISAKTGAHLEAVTAFLKGLAVDLPEAGDILTLNLRQKGLLEGLRGRLAEARRLRDATPPAWELVAEEIRGGLALLGELTGASGVDDVLHGVFASFCIGK